MTDIIKLFCAGDGIQPKQLASIIDFVQMDVDNIDLDEEKVCFLNKKKSSQKFAATNPLWEAKSGRIRCEIQLCEFHTTATNHFI